MEALMLQHPEEPPRVDKVIMEVLVMEQVLFMVAVAVVPVLPVPRPVQHQEVMEAMVWQIQFQGLLLHMLVGGVVVQMQEQLVPEVRAAVAMALQQAETDQMVPLTWVAAVAALVREVRAAPAAPVSS